METVNITGWKGKDDVVITEQRDGYKLVEHRKNKETGTVYESENFVSKQAVDTLMTLLESCVYDETIPYRYIVRKILNHYKIPTAERISEETMLSAFSGGIFRKKYYFPLYYFPMKVLEAKGLVEYFGRGGIRWKR